MEVESESKEKGSAVVAGGRGGALCGPPAARPTATRQFALRAPPLQNAPPSRPAMARAGPGGGKDPAAAGAAKGRSVPTPAEDRAGAAWPEGRVAAGPPDDAAAVVAPVDPVLARLAEEAVAPAAAGKQVRAGASAQGV